MTKRRSSRISTFGSQLTAIVSVTLVLLILGILAVIGIAGRSSADALKSNLGFIVKIERSVDETQVNRLKQYFNTAPFVASYVYSSSEEILAAESQYLGEDVSAILDVNPYGSEFDIKVTPEYASVDSIEVIAGRLSSDDLIETVLTESSMIAAVTSTLGRASWILLCIAAGLLVISIVLINNTVHLAVYSRRFVIYTMKLVGATGGFIRRPFILAGVLNGFISAAIASLLLIAMLAYGAEIDSFIGSCFSWQQCGIVTLILFVVGILICTFASLFATNRYLKADYDDMFMK